MPPPALLINQMISSSMYHKDV